MTQSHQHGPETQRNVSNALWNPCCEELRTFWEQHALTNVAAKYTRVGDTYFRGDGENLGRTWGEALMVEPSGTGLEWGKVFSLLFLTPWHLNCVCAFEFTLYTYTFTIMIDFWSLPVHPLHIYSKWVWIKQACFSPQDQKNPPKKQNTRC